MLPALSELGLSVALARNTSASGFGAFAITCLHFGSCLAVIKSAVGQPLQMRLSGASAAERGCGFHAGLGAATVLGIAYGLVLWMAGLVVGARCALVALALVLPGLVLQDNCRMVTASVVQVDDPLARRRVS